MDKSLLTLPRRLELQGFTGLSEQRQREVDRWLRLAPAICLIWAAAGFYQASPEIIAALIPFAALGALLPTHPFDVIYNYGIRFLTGGEKLPPYSAPRRFACALATVWLTVNALLFHFQATQMGYAMGILFVTVPFINITLGLCMPSYLYRLFFGYPKTQNTGQEIS